MIDGGMKKSLFILIASLFMACEGTSTDSLVIRVGHYVKSHGSVLRESNTVVMSPESWLEYNVSIPQTGRYKVIVHASSDSGEVWLEDYVYNTDRRTYDITGRMSPSNGDRKSCTRTGSPMQSGEHNLRLHAENGKVSVSAIEFIPVIQHSNTTDTMIQSTSGTEWTLKWSDEFSGDGSPDTTIWNYNLGDWGWGNNELQFYTSSDLKNARLQNGSLLIRASKDPSSGQWTSTRLTTQGKICFQYGKIEFRAKVPTGRGSWAAGWLLGDAYLDEISWPYCGEVDILEVVGFEYDSAKNSSWNHGSCHTPAYYFKKGNHITGQTAIENVEDGFHTYAVEWYPDVIYCSVDGQRYYTYDKTADELEWPFDQPQNIILNLAIGGGWGGSKGLDPKMVEQEYVIDYVRVYEKK